MNEGPDVEPRLPLLVPASLDEAQRAVYEQIAGGRRTKGPQLFPLTDEQGALLGPFNALLYAPDVGGELGRLGEAIRFRSSLSDRIREIAILTVAAYHQSDFEWWAHEQIGKHVGLQESEIQRIRHLAPLETGSPQENVVYAFCLMALRDRQIADSLFEGANEQLGRTAVSELVILIGYYEALALLLSVFRVASPDPVTWANSSWLG